MQPRKGGTRGPGERGPSPTIAFISTSLAAAAWLTAIAAALTLPPDLIDGTPAVVPGAPKAVAEAPKAVAEAPKAVAEAPKAVAEAPADSEQLQVKDRRANLRVGPTVRSAVIRELDPGSKLDHVFGGGPWVMVALPGDEQTVGWIHGSLVKRDALQARLPKIEGLRPAGATPRQAPPRQKAARRMPLIAEVGFSTFWNEVDKLSAALDCPVPEVTLGKQRTGAVYSCRFGEEDSVTVTIEGEVSSTQVKDVRLVWSRRIDDPRKGPPAMTREARRVVEGLARLYGGALKDQLVADYFTAAEGSMNAGVFRIAHLHSVKQGQEERSLVISQN